MKWIWLVNSDESSVNTYGEFIDAFKIKFDCDLDGVKGAVNAGDGVNIFMPGDKIRLKISTDSQYVLWVNSNYVSSGQYADFPDAKVYDEIDISDYLREGENSLRFLIYYQGTSSSTYLHGEPGFCYTVYNGDKIITESSSKTLGRISPAYKSGPMEMITGQLGYSFEYDASKLPVLNPYFPSAESRMALSFSDYPLKASKSVTYLYPRPIKKLMIGEEQPAEIITQGVFRFNQEDAAEVSAKKLQRAALSQRYISELTDNRNSSAPAMLPVNEDDPVRFCIDPVRGYAGIYAVIDLYRESAGYFTLDIDAAPGTKVYIGYGEHLADLRVRTYVGGRCFTGVYTCSGGRQKFTHYIKRFGLRYIQIYVTSFDFKLYYAGIRPSDYPLNDVCDFRSSDSLHNKIYKVSLDTLRLCMHEHYEDCPWREQALYAMDSRNQILAGYYSFGDYDFPKASIRLLGKSLRDDGQLELCAPAKVPVWIPSFTLMWVVELYEYVLYSGDYAFAAEEFPVVEKIIRTFWVHSKSNDQLSPFTGKGAWNFYEWSSWMTDSVPAALRKSGEDNYDAPLTLFYALALDAAANLAAWLVRRHDPEDNYDYRRQYSWYDMLHKSVVSGFHDVFWDNERGGYCTYIVNGSKVHFSELTHALALYAGAVPEKYIDRVAEILTGRKLPNLIGYSDEVSKIAPGCPAEYVPVTLSHSVFKYEALLGPGSKYAAFVFDDVAEKWGRMLFSGATSFWETLDGAIAFDDAGSLCHGWSAIPVILYGKYVLGIRPTRPGFADFAFRPLETPLLRAIGQVPLPNNESITVKIDPSGNDKTPVHIRR